MFILSSSQRRNAKLNSIAFQRKKLPTHWRQLVATEEPVVPGLLRAHLAGDGEAVVLAVLVVPLDVEMSEVDGDSEREE